MFGKKKKQQEAAAQAAAQAEQARRAAAMRNAAAPTPVAPVAPVAPMQRPVYIQPMPEQKVFYESEVINDDEEDVVEIELLLDKDTLKAAAQNQQEPDVQNIEGEPVEIQDEQEKKDADKKNDASAPQSNVINITNTVVAPQPYGLPEEKKEEKPAEPEVRYVYDGPEEDDEIVKPAKLVKLPNLVDYMLSLKMSKRMKMNVATLLLGAYAKYKDIPAEKEILIGCMKKIMYALMSEQ